jgi:large subunit ribosomal protein L7/L12
MTITKEQAIEYLDGLSTYEIMSLIGGLQDTTGIKPPVAIQQGPPPKQEVVEEQTEFDVKLVSFADKKMAVIKEVRSQTGLGLKEAKELVESLGVIREAVIKEQAEELAKAIREAGGEVELK